MRSQPNCFEVVFFGCCCCCCCCRCWGCFCWSEAPCNGSRVPGWLGWLVVNSNNRVKLYSVEFSWGCVEIELGFWQSSRFLFVNSKNWCFLRSVCLLRLRLQDSYRKKPTLLPSSAKLHLNWAELPLISLSPTIHPTSNIHPITFILQLICTLVLNGSNCKAQTRFSSNWAELALVSINLTTHPPTTPPCGTVYFLVVSCLIESIEACVA